MAVYNDKSVPDVKAVMGTSAVSTDIGADESGQGPAGVRTRIARAKAFARTRWAMGGPPAGAAMGLDQGAPERVRLGIYVPTGDGRRLEFQERRDRAMVTEDTQTGWP